ncbi:MAG: GNAT family N-acetyltransferase [Armatimonadota bacterium]
MPSRPRGRELCAAGARRVGEPLYATASRVDLWLVVEVSGAWPVEVGDSLDPGSPLGRALLPVLNAVPRSRVLFVKGAERGLRETLAFYAAVSDEAEPRLYHWELERYEDLEEIDLWGVLAGEERYDRCRQAEPLFLICTHGTHDRCCAKFGFPLYRALAWQRPERVWQSSHVGGDRFAGNLVCLPAGLYYGFVEPDDGEVILELTEQGQLYPSRWRGRTCYPPPVQAAEHFLREVEHETAIHAYRLRSHRRGGETTEARFLETGSGRQHLVRVETTLREGRRYMTCDTEEEQPVSGYRLLDHQVLPAEPEPASPGEAGYRLEPAAMRDYAFIYRLRRETLRRCLDELGMPGEERGPFCARFDVTRHRLVYAGAQDPAGAISVLERERELHLTNLHLLPAYQGRGLGAALVREVQAQARATRRRVTTQVLKVNPARAFYERLGFRVEGEEGPRYRMAWEPSRAVGV